MSVYKIPIRLLLSLSILLAVVLGCSLTDDMPANNTRDEQTAKFDKLKEQKTAVEKYFKPLMIKDGDWLTLHKENGETFEEYINSSPTLPNIERRTIYIKPIGSFSKQEMQVIEKTSEFLEIFYNLPVKQLPQQAIGEIPKDKTRTIYPKNKQIRTNYFIDDLLPKILPSDAAALICFTSYDLYPTETWHFVFGQASLDKRVGVWSLYRMTDRKKKTLDKEMLSRTLKIAAHETGHMFSMRHCTKYECLMSGTNNLQETDRRPLDVCPECMAKIA